MPQTPPHARLLVRLISRPDARIRLLCFPYAGAGVPVFAPWAHHLPEAVEVLALQLPGRGARIDEAPHTRIDPLIAEVIEAMAPELDRPFAIFGHSLGALVGFELVRALLRLGLLAPACLFVSAFPAPHRASESASLHALPDSDLVAKLKQDFGGRADALADGELRRLLLPAVRADFEVRDTYVHQQGAPLSLPILAFAGDADPVAPPPSMGGWREHTTGEFSLHVLPGDHMFLHTSQTEMLDTISDTLLRLIPELERPRAAE